METYSAANDTPEGRDSIVGKVYSQIMQIESRLLRVWFTLSVSLLPPKKPLLPLSTLPSSIVLRTRSRDFPVSLPPIGREINEIYRGNNIGILADVELNTKLLKRLRRRPCPCHAVHQPDGRIKEVNTVFARFRFHVRQDDGPESLGSSPLSDAGFEVQEERLEGLFYLEFCLKQIIANNELVESWSSSTESSSCPPWWRPDP
jgi:magnesium chelatase subunit H